MVLELASQPTQQCRFLDGRRGRRFWRGRRAFRALLEDDQQQVALLALPLLRDRHDGDLASDVAAAMGHAGRLFDDGLTRLHDALDGFSQFRVQARPGQRQEIVRGIAAGELEVSNRGPLEAQHLELLVNQDRGRRELFEQPPLHGLHERKGGLGVCFLSLFRGHLARLLPGGRSCRDWLILRGHGSYQRSMATTL